MSEDIYQLIADLEQREIVCPLFIPRPTMFNLVSAAKKLSAVLFERGPAVALHDPLIWRGWVADEQVMSARCRVSFQLFKGVIRSLKTQKRRWRQQTLWCVFTA